MAKKKKKKEDSQPHVPSQGFDTGTLKQPSSQEDFSKMMEEMQWRYPEMYEDIIQKQLQYAPQLTEAQRQNQAVLYEQAVRQSLAWAPQFAAHEQGIVSAYAPEFGKTYSALGGKINQGLSAGYTLGDELSREVEQSIRGAQTARGNYLGPAATAQEAMGKGSAMIDLYNQRIGAAQNYLQGNNPINMMALAGSATNMGQQYYGNPVVDASSALSGASSAISGAASGFGTMSASNSNFNNALLSAFGQNSENMFNTYDRSYEQYLERQAVAHGLYDRPQVGNTGAGGMQLAGAGIAAAGAIGGGLLAF